MEAGSFVTWLLLSLLSRFSLSTLDGDRGVSCGTTGAKGAAANASCDVERGTAEEDEVTVALFCGTATLTGAALSAAPLARLCARKKDGFGLASMDGRTGVTLEETAGVVLGCERLYVGLSAAAAAAA